MCRFSAPPRYQRTTPVERHRLGSFLGVIDAILEADKLALAKQRHTAQRIYERLRSEHGYAGGLTVVKDYVHEHCGSCFADCWAITFGELRLQGGSSEYRDLHFPNPIQQRRVSEAGDSNVGERAMISSRATGSRIKPYNVMATTLRDNEKIDVVYGHNVLWLTVHFLRLRMQVVKRR